MHGELTAEYNNRVLIKRCGAKNLRIAGNGYIIQVGDNGAPAAVVVNNNGASSQGAAAKHAGNEGGAVGGKLGGGAAASTSPKTTPHINQETGSLANLMQGGSSSAQAA